MPFIESLDTPAIHFLLQAGVAFKIFHHLSKIQSLRQAAEERGQATDQIVRSILFRRSTGDFVMVLMAGESQISWKSLRAYLGERRLTLAAPQDVLEQTGYEIGAVTPFGVPRSLRILADPSVFVYPEISLGSGKKGYAILIQPGLLKTLIENLEIAPLTE